MRHVAKALGQLLVAIGAIFGIVVVRLLVQGDHTALLGSAVLAVSSALPGWLFWSYAVTAERREKAAAVIRTRERFSIDEIAQLLRKPTEVAHVFIAGQIARQGLALSYQQDTRGYARRGLTTDWVPPVAPCPTCGSTLPRTETGFCPSCGARG